MAKKQPKVPVEQALETWEGCNDFLRVASEQEAMAMLTAERTGKRRVQYLLRAHARFNRCRARRERAELIGATGVAS